MLSAFKYIFLTGTFIGAAFCTLPAFADFLLPQKRIPRNHSLFIDLSSELFYSQSNFNHNGRFINLEHSNYITFFNYKLHLIYVPISWLHIEPYIHAQTPIVKQETTTNHLPFILTKTGLKASLFVHTPFVALSPELDFSYPLDNQKNRIVTNDGVIKLTPALFIHFSSLNSFIPFGKIAYQYRQYLSGLLIYHAGFMYQDNVWELGALLGGFHSISPDKTPNVRKATLDQFNAGSLKFYSSNPSTLGTTVWVDLKLSKKTQIVVHYGVNFWGLNYAQGHSLNIGIKLGFVKPRSSLPYRRAVYDFEAEKKEDMESLFNEDQ